MMMGKDKNRQATISEPTAVPALHEVIVRNWQGHETVVRVLAVSESEAHSMVEQSVQSTHVPVTQVVNVTRTA